MNVESANYIRILRLLLDIGTDVYRETFISRFPTISSYGDLFQPLENRLTLLNEWQREMIFPPSGKYEGDLTDLDISVFYILLRNISNICPHKKGWGKKPEDTDRSMSANVERIRIIRNKYVCHSPKSKISEFEFKTQWDILRQSILELPSGDTYKEKIDRLLTTPLDPDQKKISISMRKKENARKRLYEDKTSAIEKDMEATKRKQRKITDTVRALHHDTLAFRRYQKTFAELQPITKGLQRKQSNLAAIQDEQIQLWRTKLEKFVETSFSSEAYQVLQSHQIVLLTGSSGSGKTATAFFVAQRMAKEGYDIHTARSPVDLIELASRKKELYIFDDVCGRFALNNSCVDLWEQYETDIKCLLERNTKVKLLFTSRPQIAIKDNLMFYSTLHISEINLTLSLDERRSIALSYMSKSVVENIDDTTVLMYPFFPFLCERYADNKIQTLEEFFTTPAKIIHEELQSMACKDKLSFFALSFLVISNNKIVIENLKQRSEIFDQISRSICEEFDGEIHFRPTRRSVLSRLERMQNIYTSKLNGSFQTIHDKMFDIVSAYFGPKFLQSILLYGSSAFIANRMLLESLEERKEENIILIPENFEKMYFNRMLRSITEGEYWESFGNIQSKATSYRKKILGYLAMKEITEIQPSKGIHPLFISSFLGYTDFLKYLLKHNKNLINLPDSIGRTPLFAASRNGFSNIVKTLIRNGANVNTYTPDGWSPLIIATHKGHSDIVELLFQNGAMVNATKHISPLYIACENGSVRITELLLQHNMHKALLAFKNEFGWTPLHIACQNGHVSIVKMLVKAGCDINAVECKKCTALDVAIANKHIKIVQFLRMCKRLKCARVGKALSYQRKKVRKMVKSKSPRGSRTKHY